MPPELGQLTSLTTLHLYSNNITTLPSSFRDLVHLQNFAVDDHVADDPDSATAVQRLREYNVTVIQHPSGRTPQKIRLLKKLSARRVMPSPAPMTSSTAREKTVEELLAELGELSEESGTSRQSNPRSKSKGKGQKGKR